MSDGFETTAYKRRGDALTDIDVHDKGYTLRCADCSGSPIIATLYDVPSGGFVEALRRTVWRKPGDDFEISGVPTFLWVLVPVERIGERFPLTCWCQKHQSVLWSDVLHRIRNRPTIRVIRIHRGGRLAM